MATTASNDLQKALDLFAALEAVDLAKLPVMTEDRRIPRKEQAALARKLFRMLGLKGVSFTAPNYSQAHSVDVSWPRRDDYTVRDGDGFPSQDDPARLANNAAFDKVQAILDAAFPAHRDRSDSRTDYFDFKWSLC